MITTFTATLQEKKQLTHDIYWLTFQPKGDVKLDFTAGQYFILHCPQPSGTAARRLYSIASPSSQKDSFDLLAEIVPNGVASNLFLQMQPGHEATFQGPAGMFTLRENNLSKVFLATGTGLAPMLSIFKSHTLPENSLLLWGMPYLEEVYLFEELKSLAKQKNIEFKICLSRQEDFSVIAKEDEPYFAKGRVTNALEEHYAQKFNTTTEFYVCGGRTVVESLKQYLLDKSIPKEHIVFEKF